MKQISVFFPPIQNITKSNLATLPELFEKIRNDQEVRSHIEKIRNIREKKERDKCKATWLFVITFSGIFLERKKERLKEHSGLVCIDIDKLLSESFLEAMQALQKLQESLVGYFISPSGDGYKVILKVDHKKHSQEENYLAATAFLKSKIKIDDAHFDKACKDVARACFISYDPDAFLNQLANSEENFEKIPVLETEKWLVKKESHKINPPSPAHNSQQFFTPYVSHRRTHVYAWFFCQF